MREILPKNLSNLASTCENIYQKPLYVIGGSVRDYLAKLQPNGARDWDICSPLSADDFLQAALSCGFKEKAVFRHTGTVKLIDEENVEYEYTCFRSDKYVRGTHVPIEIFFTDDITMDARRRDFTCNAIYYDIQKDTFVDPLDGISSIKEKKLTTVDNAEKVFGEDGLRLMRLARQAAQLGFYPDEECFSGAKKNAALIQDISPERIFTELTAILHSDEKYGNTDGPYQGIRLLHQTGVLTHIAPELTLGDGMAQRADFHKYDVLEHSFRCVKYADKSIRLAALLHDVGKPFCKLRDGNSYQHPVEGARITKEILTRWKAPKKTIERVCSLVEWHMYDMNSLTSENKLRRFFVNQYPFIDDLILLKQADYSACMDDLGVAPTSARWTALLAKMKMEKAPLTLKELAISGKEILDNTQIQPKQLSAVLQQLLLHAAVNPKDNEKERLLRLAVGFSKSIE